MINIKPVNELPQELATEAKLIDEAVLRVTYKFLISGGMTHEAAITYTKQLSLQGFFKEFPCQNNKGDA